MSDETVAPDPDPDFLALDGTEVPPGEQDCPQTVDPVDGSVA